MSSSSPPLRASIVVIGDELLGGFVKDTNSHFLATRLQANAVPLDRVHVVPDEFDAIDEALRAELGRARPRLVLTTGGIGSTPDDITFEAVAASLGRGVVEEPSIRELLDGALSWTRSQGVEVDAEAEQQFLRMGRIPEGSTLIETGSWTPAVRVDVDGGIDDDGGATIVILPGIPSLTRTLVESGIEPNLIRGRNDPWVVEEITHGFPESLLNPAFAKLADAHPDVKLGSYPGQPMLVRLTGEAEHVRPAAELVRAEIAALEATEGGRRIAEAWAARGRTGSDEDGA